MTYEFASLGHLTGLYPRRRVAGAAASVAVLLLDGLTSGR